MSNYSNNEAHNYGIASLPMELFSDLQECKFKDVLSCRFNDLLSYCRAVVQTCCFRYVPFQLSGDSCLWFNTYVYRYLFNEALTCLGN